MRGSPAGSSSPILPGITDSAVSIAAVAAAAKAHGAVSIGSAVLRLAPNVKEHYFGFVAETFPDLLPRYERAYVGTNISSTYQTAIERRVARMREHHGFAEDAMQRCKSDPVYDLVVAQPSADQSAQLCLPL